MTTTYTSGTTVVKSNNQDGVISSRLYVNGGETATLRCARHTTEEGAARWANRVLGSHARRVAEGNAAYEAAS